MTFLYENVFAHVVFADSAHPRKASIVTRPFPILWVGSGDETRSLTDKSREFICTITSYVSPFQRGKPGRR